MKENTVNKELDILLDKTARIVIQKQNINSGTQPLFYFKTLT